MTHLVAGARDRPASLDAISLKNRSPGDLVSDAPSADRLIASAEARSAFHRAIAMIDRDLSNAFHLREIEGLSYDEIAKVTGVPINTVKTRIFRARMQLRKSLVGHRE